jgi:hypothetical protein
MSRFQFIKNIFSHKKVAKAPDSSVRRNANGIEESELKPPKSLQGGVFEEFWLYFLKSHDQQRTMNTTDPLLEVKLKAKMVAMVFAPLFLLFGILWVMFSTIQWSFGEWHGLVYLSLDLVITLVVFIVWIKALNRTISQIQKSGQGEEILISKSREPGIEEPIYSFIRKGKFFEIIFEDEKHIVTQLAGLVIIEALLMESNKEFPPIHLAQINAKQEHKISGDGHNLRNIGIVDGFGTDHVRDQSTIDGVARLKKSIDKLEIKMKIAAEDGMDELAKKHDLEIAEIEKHIYSLQDNKGNDREMRTVEDTAANTVYTNIKNAKKKLFEPMPKFHQHITDHIKRDGNYFKYSGDTESLPIWGFK